MARIRSVHPGFWKDENTVEVSAFARLLLIGAGNFADDFGIFKWKPKTLKMEVFPADNLDVAELLAELSENGLVMQFEIDGRKYGAIRNFTEHQRPKKPRGFHPRNSDVNEFIGLDDTEVETSSPPVPHQAPTPTEIAPQREEGGGRRVSSSKREKGFAEFWDVFGDKQARQPALRSWKAIRGYDPNLHREIIAGARRYAAARPALLDRGGTPKMAQGWLTDRRWEDVLEKPAGTVVEPREYRFPDEVRKKA